MGRLIVPFSLVWWPHHYSLLHRSLTSVDLWTSCTTGPRGLHVTTMLVPPLCTRLSWLPA
ncbi:hypothetical protein E2562_017132 [Oryza meyeriana var. granulata]|uniref:Uncharacterized protein n=1 Tax=Oryza meyeriana var. granulata TaxID=110450 RepID=A0A6G1DYE5_9ORYZ|nr:hypothetical protein E2562_017132 [Oryza meyeriana var. granulata]